MKSIKKTSNNHTTTCVNVTKEIIEDLMIFYNKSSFLKEKLEIAKTVKGLCDTGVSAAQVTVNAVKISILAKSKDITYKSIQS
jgi:hypothetical protein